MYLIQISMYLVQVSYMFQPYMVVMRLAYKKENKYTVLFRIKISLLYLSICIKYIHFDLDSLRNAVGKNCNVLSF
jgi:hypothetical protein